MFVWETPCHLTSSLHRTNQLEICAMRFECATPACVLRAPGRAGGFQLRRCVRFGQLLAAWQDDGQKLAFGKTSE